MHNPRMHGIEYCLSMMAAGAFNVGMAVDAVLQGLRHMAAMQGTDRSEAGDAAYKPRVTVQARSLEWHISARAQQSGTWTWHFWLRTKPPKAVRLAPRSVHDEGRSEGALVRCLIPDAVLLPLQSAALCLAVALSVCTQRLVASHPGEDRSRHQRSGDTVCSTRAGT